MLLLNDCNMAICKLEDIYVLIQPTAIHWS